MKRFCETINRNHAQFTKMNNITVIVHICSVWDQGCMREATSVFTATAVAKGEPRTNAENWTTRILGDWWIYLRFDVAWSAEKYEGQWKYTRLAAQRIFAETAPDSSWSLGMGNHFRYHKFYHIGFSILRNAAGVFTLTFLLVTRRTRAG